MSKEIVRYHNDMNRLNLGAFSSKELDLFFSICYRLKELGTKEIILSFDELKNLTRENSNPKRFKSYINNLNKNLSYLSYQLEIKENVFSRFVLFTNFTTDFNKNTLTIKVNDDFGYFLNNLVKEFTKFELEQFVNLKSSYSKNVFKLLKQWETKKERIFTLEEFKNLLGIPMTYTIDNINRRVLNQIMKELSPYFKDLKLEKIKTGRSITSLKFTWKNDLKAIQILEDNTIHISEKLNKVIEKAKKNRYIKLLLTEKNIIKLLKEFNEEQLIKGLNHAYEEVKKEIKHLSYLIKAIETGAGKQEIKIKVAGNIPVPKEEVEVVKVVETTGEGKKKEVEEENEAYRNFLKMSEEAQQEVEKIVYKEYVKECGQDTKIQKLAFRASKRKLIIDFLETRYNFRKETNKYYDEIEKKAPKEEVVKVKPKREMTQNQYDCLFQIYLSNIKLTMNRENRENREIDVEEERKKFDLANKDSITIIKKEITREELLNKFNELNFNYSLEELEEAFKLIDTIYTNQELLDTINSTNRELLDSIVESMRKIKAG